MKTHIMNANHTHHFTRRTPASSVETCTCGKFRHVNVNPADVITEHTADHQRAAEVALEALLELTRGKDWDPREYGNGLLLAAAHDALVYRRQRERLKDDDEDRYVIDEETQRQAELLGGPFRNS